MVTFSGDREQGINGGRGLRKGRKGELTEQRPKRGLER